MEEYKRLIEEAKRAMEKAYVPYSHFKVGAAVLTKSGKIYSGCNIENASFGATNCAERTAIFKAVSEGERVFSKIAIVSSGKDVTYPCGICRQVMSEFMQDAEVIFESADGEVKIFSLEEIFPFSFTQKEYDQLGGKR
jgi:cytidine deaminase